jgi:hypothetical protein
MRKRGKPHCSHVSHFALCDCGHAKMMHADEPEGALAPSSMEMGHCTEARCKCESFRPTPGRYRPEQLEHETVPI